MAELFVSYGDLETLVDQYISECSDNQRLKDNKAEILTALTCDFERNSNESIDNIISLWVNQIHEPSQILMGTRYIPISDVLLSFFRMALTSGFIDYVISFLSIGTIPSVTVSVSSSVAYGLWDIFNSVKKLDDWDFCVYMQAVTHFSKFKEFDIDVLKSWFPHGIPQKCNMHTSNWGCEYLDSDDNCNIFSEEKIQEALNSLLRKGLLLPKRENNKTIYKFKI